MQIGVIAGPLKHWIALKKPTPRDWIPGHVPGHVLGPPSKKLVKISVGQGSPNPEFFLEPSHKLRVPALPKVQTRIDETSDQLYTPSYCHILPYDLNSPSFVSLYTATFALGKLGLLACKERYIPDPINDDH